MDARAERIGKNEALFREVNERVAEVNRDFGALGAGEFVCECGYSDCTDRITLPLDEYRRIRGDATMFFVKPGHEIPDVEDVAEEHGAYVVVKKHEGDPAALAEQLDRTA